MARPNKATEADVGLLLDMALPQIKEQFVVTLDADAFATSKDWLEFPIWLLEQLNCSSVGCDTGLSTSYLDFCQGQGFWQDSSGYIPECGLYDNNWFTCTNNFFRVMHTLTAQVASEQIGYSRSTGKLTFKDKLILRLPDSLRKTLGLENQLSRHGYMPTGADNGVAANHFLDVNRLGPKFNLPITSFYGFTASDGVFGQNISGLLIHFALSTRALSLSRREVSDPGASFLSCVEVIKKASEGDQQPLTQFIEEASKVKPGGQNGSIPATWYEDQSKLVERYKKAFRSHRGKIQPRSFKNSVTLPTELG